MVLFHFGFFPETPGPPWTPRLTSAPLSAPAPLSVTRTDEGNDVVALVNVLWKMSDSLEDRGDRTAPHAPPPWTGRGGRRASPVGGSEVKSGLVRRLGVLGLLGRTDFQ